MYSMSVLSNNLKFLRKAKGFTQEELAEKLGMTRSILGSYEESRAEPKLFTLQNITKYFQVSIDDILSKDLSKESGTAVGIVSELRVLPIVVSPENRELVNIVPNKASAGYLNGFADQEYIKDLSCFSLPLNEISQDRTYRIFQIKGDSMLPIAPDSYIITYYQENWQDIKDNDCYVVLTKEEGIVYKRIVNKISECNSLVLKSDNLIYEPYEIKLETVLEIWKAIGYISFRLPKGEELSLEKLSSLVLELQKELSDMKKTKN
ncbi:MAG TPA: transcriptional regulator [Cytophagales bacterium]|nr:transcriptional regulator [Cytophagales bacterium]